MEFKELLSVMSSDTEFREKIEALSRYDSLNKTDILVNCIGYLMQWYTVKSKLNLLESVKSYVTKEDYTKIFNNLVEENNRCKALVHSIVIVHDPQYEKEDGANELVSEASTQTKESLGELSVDSKYPEHTDTLEAPEHQGRHFEDNFNLEFMR